MKSTQQAKRPSNNREILGLKKTVDSMANSLVRLQQVINAMTGVQGQQVMKVGGRKGNQNAKIQVVTVDIEKERKEEKPTSGSQRSEVALEKDIENLALKRQIDNKEGETKKNEEKRANGKGLMRGMVTHHSPYVSVFVPI